MLDETTGAVAEETTTDSSAVEETSTATETTEIDAQVDETTEQTTEETTSTEQETTTEGEKPAPKTDELQEFQGSVSARLKELDKRAPGLAAHLNKFPQVRDAIAATFRREAAARELFPGGLAEMQTIRDYFPRGEEDIKEVLGEIESVEQLDSKFYGRDAQGNYPGHTDFIQNLAAQDKDATIALLKRSPAEWAKLDPESYHESLSRIFSTTLTNDRVYEHMDLLADLAKEIKNPELSQRISQLSDYLNRFQPQRPKEPSEEERRTRADREQLNREKAERHKEEGTRFHQSFVSDSLKFQRDLIGQHPLLKNLPESITPQKKQGIIEDIRKRIVAHLDKSRPFKAKFNTAYEARDAKGVMEAQKNYWTGWLMNLYVRKVLNDETPGMVAGSQARPAARPAARTAAPNGKPAPRTKAYQGADKRWYRPDGTPFTTQEVLRGAHLQ